MLKKIICIHANPQIHLICKKKRFLYYFINNFILQFVNNFFALLLFKMNVLSIFHVFDFFSDYYCLNLHWQPPFFSLLLLAIQQSDPSVRRQHYKSVSPE